MTYFVDAQNGDDAADGTTADTAWQTLAYAASMMGPGDLLMIIAPATYPARDGMICADGTYTGSGTRAYLLGTVDMTHGNTVRNLVKNGGMEAWLTTAQPWAVTAAGDAIARSVTAHGGTYSVNATRTGVDIVLTLYSYLPANTSVTLAYWHKDSVAGRWKYRVKDIVGNVHLQADGSWGAVYLNDPNDFNTSWHSASRTFTTNSEGRYEISFLQQFNEVIYLDDVSLGYAGIAVYQWSDVAGKNYKQLNVPVAKTPGLMMTCTEAEWSANGSTALEESRLAADLATLDSTPGAWYYDAANSTLYYYPADGEDISTVHIEVAQPQLTTSATQVSGLVMLNGSGVALNNLDIRCADIDGVLTGTSIDRLFLNDIDVAYCPYYCVHITNGSLVVARDCSARYGDDGFYASASASFSGRNCLSEYNDDDGFQVAGGATMALVHCVSRQNGLDLLSHNSGFAAEGINTTMVLLNCTGCANYGRGIVHQSTGTGHTIVRNCISYGTVFATDNDAFTEAITSPLYSDHNLFGGHKAAWTLDPTDQIADPLFVDMPDNLHLQSDSPAIGAGVDVGLFYSGDAPDCGAFERWASRGATWLHLAGVHEED